MSFSDAALVKNPPANSGKARDVGTADFKIKSMLASWPRKSLLAANHSSSLHFENTVCVEIINMGFPGSSDGKESACIVGDQVRPLDQEYPLEKEMATHSSILAWEIPWTEEQAGYRVGHSWATKHSNATFPLYFCI